MKKNRPFLPLFAAAGFYGHLLKERACQHSMWDLPLTACLYLTMGKSFAELETLTLVYGKFDYSQYPAFQKQMNTRFYRLLCKAGSFYPKPQLFPREQERE